MKRARRQARRVTRHLTDRLLAESNKVGIEGTGLDLEQRSPLDGDAIFFCEAAGCFLRFVVHRRQHVGVERALIDRYFRRARDRCDKSRLDFDDANRADDAGAGPGVTARDLATFEGSGCGGEECIVPHRNRRRPRVRGLADKPHHVPHEPEGSHHDSRRPIHRFDLLSPLGGVREDSVVAQCVFQPGAAGVGESTDFIDLQGAGRRRRAQEAAPETRPLFICPIDEPERHRRLRTLFVSSKGLERRHDAERSIQPPAVRH